MSVELGLSCTLRTSFSKYPYLGVVQVGEQKAPLVQANFLAAIPLLKKLFVKQPPQTVKVPEPTPQPEWFNAGATGMKFTLYDENNTPLYSETMAVGNISPFSWGRLVQKYDPHCL